MLDLVASEWQYFARGKANLLLSCLTGRFDGKLLRLRLKNDKNYQSTEQINSFLDKQIRPILGDYLPAMELVLLSPTFIANVNNQLRGMLVPLVETSESFGIIIENCLPRLSCSYPISKFASLHVSECTKEYVLELKPKWLYNNINTSYCRNCASEKFFRKSSKKTFCSNGLISCDKRIILQTIVDIFQSIASENPAIKLCRQALLGYLESESNILKLLCHYQNIDDNKVLLKNLNGPQDVSEALLLGMTLRDVTLFFRIVQGSGNESTFKQQTNQGRYELTVKIVDVDAKSREKWSYWKATEQTLIGGNAYEDVDLTWGKPCI